LVSQLASENTATARVFCETLKAGLKFETWELELQA